MAHEITSIDTFARARSLKTVVLQNIPILQPTPSPSNERTTATSFEDILITTLRAEGKPWSNIAASLNSRSVSHNEAPTWTEAAVYSRFILSNSGSATPAKEIGFEPRDYAHLRNAGSGREGTSKAGKKRVKDFQNATELSANIRRPAMIAGADGEHEEEESGVVGKGKGKGRGRAGGKSKGKDEDRRKGESEGEVVKMDEVMIGVLMHAVAKVERNFWVFVADEVEREGGKYVEPRDLERVFHAV